MTRWYEKSGKETDVVVSSRVRLARNTTQYPFSTKINANEQKKLIDTAFETIAASEFSDIMEYKKLCALKENERCSLYEQQIINRYMAGRNNGAVAVSKDRSVSVMINSEDHFRIQTMISGMDIEACYKSADIIDDLLERKFEYAFSERYGYHTTYPTNLGTGMRAAYRLHLPALANTKKISILANELGRFGIKMSPCIGEGMNGLGDLYQISNQHTLGASEQDIMHNLESVVVQIVDQERELREDFVNKSRIKAEDEAYKSYGVLKYSRCLTLQSAMVLLSGIMMGQKLKTIEFQDDDFSVYGMMLGILPRTLQYKYARDEGTSVSEVDVLRAKYIREHLPEIK